MPVGFEVGRGLELRRFHGSTTLNPGYLSIIMANRANPGGAQNPQPM